MREESSIKEKKKIHHNRNDYTPYNPSSTKLAKTSKLPNDI